MLGGGSSINGQLANRGAPTDYDEWVEKGAAGWGWKDVLPYFKKVERDMDFDGPFHGKEGRIPVRRIFPDTVERPRQGGRRRVRGGRVPLRRGPERRVRAGRLFPDHHLEPLRPACLGGDRLSR